jgi:Mycolic acid cyclopropane synthetase
VADGAAHRLARVGQTGAKLPEACVGKVLLAEAMSDHGDHAQLGGAAEDLRFYGFRLKAAGISVSPKEEEEENTSLKRDQRAWWTNFERAWPSLRDRYGDAFYRMWKFYLLSSAAQFRTRRLNLMQISATVIGTQQPPYVRAS